MDSKSGKIICRIAEHLHHKIVAEIESLEELFNYVDAKRPSAFLIYLPDPEKKPLHLSEYLVGEGDEDPPPFWGIGTPSGLPGGGTLTAHRPEEDGAKYIEGYYFGYRHPLRTSCLLDRDETAEVISEFVLSGTLSKNFLWSIGMFTIG